MATENYYYQSANASAAYVAQFGAPLAAGGGAGTEASPFADFSGVEALVESKAPDHSADDLVLHFHPAFFATSASTVFDTWTDVARAGAAGGWNTVTLKRWEQKVIDDPRLASWYPTIDTLQPIASGDWTRGSITAGVWSAGVGTVYRTTASILTAGNSPTRLMCWGGHEIGDNTAAYQIAGTFCWYLSSVNEVGDYALTLDSGSNYFLYVDTGDSSQNPTQKWGYFCYSTYAGAGASAIVARNAIGLRFTDFQVFGGQMDLKPGTNSQTTTDLILTRVRHRFGGGAGGWNIGTGSLETAINQNLTVIDPDMDYCDSLRSMKGADTSGQSNERGACNGLNAQGNVDGLWIYNPKIGGYSHGQIQCQSDESSTLDMDEWPKNCHIICNDNSNGKCHIWGAKDYQRGLNWAIPGSRSYVGPLRVSQQTVQSQIGGQVQLRGLYFDDTCPAYSDDYGSSNCNVGHHLALIGSVHGTHTFADAVQNLDICGTKHDLVGGYAIYWSTLNKEDGVRIRGALVRDNGEQRYRVATTLANKNWTRRRTPFCGRSTSTTQPQYQKMLNNWIIATNEVNAVEGMVATHKSGGGQSVNANAASDPVNAYDASISGEDAAIDYTAARIAGNQQLTGVTSGFDFNANLEYTGTRKTPIQTSPGRKRGYK